MFEIKSIEAEKSQEPIELPSDTPILVVCANGRTRSKYVARMLSQMGFENVRIAGLHDPHSREESRRVGNYPLIITAGEKDLISQLKHDGRFPHDKSPTILHVPITEREHGQLHLWHQSGKTEMIEELLKPKIDLLPLKLKQ